MIGNFVHRYINIPIVALFLVTTASFSAVVSMTTAVPHAGASAYGSYPFQPYPNDVMSVRNDRCYSNLNRFANSVKLFGMSDLNFGLVNAVVNLPIYDWDHDGHGNPMYDGYQATGSTIPIGSQGLRGSLEGKSVGYAERFNFSVAPIPNMTWVSQYLTKQLPYDVSMITAGGGGPKGTHADPLIANPFIYTQGSIITPGGMPRFQALSGPLYDNAPVHGGLPDIWEIPELLGGAAGSRKDELSTERDANREILNNSGDIIGAIRGVDREVDNFIGMLASTPILQNLNAHGYEVDAWDNTGKRTLCYETMDGGNPNIAPAYAFSVPGVGIPVTIPGWIFSIATLIDNKGFSASGMTMYLGGSINGKDMLDCFGRGIQPTVYGHNTTRMAPEWVFIVPTWPGLSLPMAALNGVLYGMMEANGVGEIARHLPAIITAHENYTTGYSFLFDVHESVVENPAARRTLPEHLNKRAVDYSKSKLADINLYYAIGGDGRGHDRSQNAQQFNPDVYLKLYSPFVLGASVDFSTDPRKTPDGTEVGIKIDATKHGFKDDSRADGGYKEDTGENGGPTYDPNKPAGSDRSFSEARVYKMVMKPGTVVNAIDASKVESGTDEHYRADTDVAVGASTDPCEFFANQLRVGDTGAKPSKLTPGESSNANNDLPTVPVIENKPLADEDANFACGEIVSKRLEIPSTRGGENIDEFTEKIPSETPPGTKICFAVYYTDYTNDLKTAGNHWWNPAANHPNWNPNHNTPGDKTYLTRAHCIISGYKPSLQVRGGDMLVDGSVDTGTNSKEYLASGDDPKEVRTYGSWAEYGVIASGHVNRIGSGGLHRTGMPAGWENIGYLTFSNSRIPGGGADANQYGEYADDLDNGFDRVARQFTAMNTPDATPITGGDVVEVNGLEGVYTVSGNVTLANEDRAGADVAYEIEEKKPIIILAKPGATITINNNIKIPNNYTSISDMSQVVIAPAEPGAAYRINLAHTVTSLDAWLINPAGTINTCHTGVAGSDVANTPRANNLCHNALEINGPVTAKDLLLRRTGGSDQGTDTAVRQSIPAENFNLRPDAYIWAAEYVSAGGKKYITTHSKDLPPRY